MSKKNVVVVTGGRTYNDMMTVYRELQKVKPTRVATGACHRGGADRLAEQWAFMKGIPYKGYPANWRTLGWAAGPIRNGEMLKAEKPDMVLAFPGGSGTADCVKQAKKLGIPVIEVGADHEGNQQNESRVEGKVARGAAKR